MATVPEHQAWQHLSLPAGPSHTELVIGRGVLARAHELLAPYRESRLLLVSDAGVAPLYAAPLRETLLGAGYDAHLLTIPAGETAKTLEVVSHLYAACHDLGVERSDTVVAVGGGVVGDVAGMIAGTYMRGLRFVQVPTTLVAQVTASIGGKVGVNFRGDKNLVGMFYQPAHILIDLATLETLPEVEFRSGLGELITVGVLGAPAIFEALEVRGTADLGTLIAAAIRCKSAIVEADPYDQLGIRAHLNLGHTFGHALEKLSDFMLAHGLAVAVGLHIASRLAGRIGLCPPSLAERVERVLLALDLPTSVSGYRPEQVIQAMRSDKKRHHGQLRLVLPLAIGQVALVDERDVSPAVLEDVLGTLVGEGG